MTEDCQGARPRSAWLLAALLATAAGALAAVIFAAVWFDHAAEGDGLVRFFEQAFGVIVLGGWLLVTGVGLSVAFIGRRRGSRTVASGALIACLASVVMALVAAKTTIDIRRADYSLKETPRLLEILRGADPDARKEAAHALGERRASEAVDPLCTILDQRGEDINLRLNAAMALGKIYAPPRAPDTDLDRALSSLLDALKSPDAYLPVCAAEALGKIGDGRAVGPLANLLANDARPVHIRCEAALALSRIGGQDARTALEMARDAATPPDVADAARRCLFRMQRREDDPPSPADRD